MPVDLAPLWNFRDPAASEARFRAALEHATGDDALVLRTQIARSLGLRRDFEGARRLLRELEPSLPVAGAEPRVRHRLEWGRTFASATHRPEDQSDATRATALAAFEDALATARASGLDALAIDAIHMLAFVDVAPDRQLHWSCEALAVSLSSLQPSARRWEPSIRHNVGYALHQLGRHDEALDEFRRALALRELGADAEATRVARWMVAWTLRSLGRLDEALALQQSLEAECAAAGAPDPHVFDELAALHRARGDEGHAASYDAKAARVRGAS
jgi:tetratricopeptide (TPR) repeat protein